MDIERANLLVLLLTYTSDYTGTRTAWIDVGEIVRCLCIDILDIGDNGLCGINAGFVDGMEVRICTYG